MWFLLLLPLLFIGVDSTIEFEWFDPSQPTYNYYNYQQQPYYYQQTDYNNYMQQYYNYVRQWSTSSQNYQNQWPTSRPFYLRFQQWRPVYGRVPQQRPQFPINDFQTQAHHHAANPQFNVAGQRVPGPVPQHNLSPNSINQQLPASESGFGQVPERINVQTTQSPTTTPKIITTRRIAEATTTQAAVTTTQRLPETTPPKPLPTSSQPEVVANSDPSPSSSASSPIEVLPAQIENEDTDQEGQNSEFEATQPEPTNSESLNSSPQTMDITSAGKGFGENPALGSGDFRH